MIIKNNIQLRSFSRPSVICMKNITFSHNFITKNHFSSSHSLNGYAQIVYKTFENTPLDWDKLYHRENFPKEIGKVIDNERGYVLSSDDKSIYFQKQVEAVSDLSDKLGYTEQVGIETKATFFFAIKKVFCMYHENLYNGIMSQRVNDEIPLKLQNDIVNNSSDAKHFNSVILETLEKETYGWSYLKQLSQGFLDKKQGYDNYVDPRPNISSMANHFSAHSVCEYERCLITNLDILAFSSIVIFLFIFFLYVN